VHQQKHTTQSRLSVTTNRSVYAGTALKRCNAPKFITFMIYKICNPIGLTYQIVEYGSLSKPGHYVGSCAIKLR
jgi:hypothetical protein